jgi:cryptochrome
MLVKKAGSPEKPLDKPKLINTPDVDGMQLPTMEEFGIDTSQLGTHLYPGGETEALKRLAQSTSNENWVRLFEKPKTAPNSLKPSTTVLSPYLKFGCLSPRTFYYRLLDVYSRGKHSEPPVSLMGQLYWREFFYYVAAHTENFDKM